MGDARRSTISRRPSGPAQCTGLLGPSGSGKSTLMQVDRRRAGDPLGLAARVRPRRRAAPLLRSSDRLHDPGTFGVRRPDGASRTSGTSPASCGRLPKRVDEVIEAVGLEAERDRVVDRLSGGQRARVSLAAALVGEPELLVLDEPTVGLDPVLRRDLWAMFASSRAERDDAPRLESRHGRGEALRRAPAPPRGAPARHRAAPDELPPPHGRRRPRGGLPPPRRGGARR